MSNFDPNAILRGAQLTLVGANRALQNPDLFKGAIFRHLMIAVAGGLLIQLLVSFPVLLIKVGLWFLGLFVDLEAEKWDDQLVDSLNFVQHSVLQVPFFLMNLVKFLSPALDDMFMQSLDWVDRTYMAKHQSDSPDGLRAMYYPNLKQYHSDLPPKSKSRKKSPLDGIAVFLRRYARKAGFSLVIFILSYIPYIGRFVLPAASFYYFRSAVGNAPAVAVFATGLVLPKRYLVRFLQTYFSSRSMMRELLEPYFSRVYFTPTQKKLWFFDREGVLFGFGAAFFLMVKIPIVGILVYGVAEASTAYLITKITDPPPPPEQRQPFIESQVRWTNKTKFMTLPVEKLDALNVLASPAGQRPSNTGVATKLPERKFE